MRVISSVIEPWGICVVVETEVGIVRARYFTDNNSIRICDINGVPIFHIKIELRQSCLVDQLIGYVDLVLGLSLLEPTGLLEEQCTDMKPRWAIEPVCLTVKNNKGGVSHICVDKPIKINDRLDRLADQPRDRLADQPRDRLADQPRDRLADQPRIKEKYIISARCGLVEIDLYNYESEHCLWVRVSKAIIVDGQITGMLIMFESKGLQTLDETFEYIHRVLDAFNPPPSTMKAAK